MRMSSIGLGVLLAAGACYALINFKISTLGEETVESPKFYETCRAPLALDAFLSMEYESPSHSATQINIQMVESLDISHLSRLLDLEATALSSYLKSKYPMWGYKKMELQPYSPHYWLEANLREQVRYRMVLDSEKLLITGYVTYPSLLSGAGLGRFADVELVAMAENLKSLPDLSRLETSTEYFEFEICDDLIRIDQAEFSELFLKEKIEQLYSGFISFETAFILEVAGVLPRAIAGEPAAVEWFAGNESIEKALYRFESFAEMAISSGDANIVPLPDDVRVSLEVLYAALHFKNELVSKLEYPVAFTGIALKFEGEKTFLVANYQLNNPSDIKVDGALLSLSLKEGDSAIHTADYSGLLGNLDVDGVLKLPLNMADELINRASEFELKVIGASVISAPAYACTISDVVTCEISPAN